MISFSLWNWFFVSVTFLGVVESKYTVNTSGTNSVVTPVIIVPGDGASPIYAKVNRKKSALPGCPTKTNWYRLWLNIADLWPNRLHCTLENMRLVFNPSTNKSTPPEGVEIKIPGWGTSTPVEYADSSFFARMLRIGYDAAPLVDEMVTWGYKRDKSVRGAPYDFRLAMASQPDLFVKLKYLVEDTWAMNEGRKVAIISHSMGGLFATWFLNGQTQEWKDKFIHSFISLSAPWGGSRKAIKSLTSGINFKIPFLNPLDARKVERTFESNYLLLPNHNFFKPDAVFVYTEKRNYTLTPKDMDSYFIAIGNPIGSLIYRKVRSQNRYTRKVNGIIKRYDLMPPHPHVRTYCLYGVGVKSMGGFRFPKNFPDGPPVSIPSDGDGSISVNSLSGCKYWIRDYPSSSNYNSTYHTRQFSFPGVSHVEIFGSVDAQNVIRSILTGKI